MTCLDFVAVIVGIFRVMENVPSARSQAGVGRTEMGAIASHSSRRKRHDWGHG
jgi:hypothetical protein